MTEETKRDKILIEARLKEAEYERKVYVVNAEHGTTINDVLEPAYWAHVAPKLRPYTRLEVRIDSGEWMLELLVLSCDRTWAKVAVLHRYELAPGDEDMPPASKHKVEFKGPHWKWCVIRVADGGVIFKGLEKEQAFAELERHERTMAA